MKYERWKTLQKKDNIGQGPCESVRGILFVGDSPCFRWQDDHGPYGYNYCEMFPAFYNGGRGFVIEENWQATGNYSDYGTDQYFIGLKAGLKILIDNDAVDILYE